MNLQYSFSVLVIDMAIKVVMHIKKSEKPIFAGNKRIIGKHCWLLGGIKGNNNNFKENNNIKKSFLA